MFKSFIRKGAVVLLAIFSGCSSLQNDKKAPVPEFSSLSAEQSALLRQRTEAFTQSMVRSFRSGDFSHWQACVEKESSPNSPPVISKDRFQKMRSSLEKQWGKLVKCHYLGSLDQSIFRDFIWKCTFESQSDDGQLIRLEELFVVRCTLLKGKIAFTGFGFRFFNKPGFRDQVIKIKKAEVKNEKTN